MVGIFSFCFSRIVEARHPSQGDQAQGGRLISGCIPRLVQSGCFRSGWRLRGKSNIFLPRRTQRTRSSHSAGGWILFHSFLRVLRALRGGKFSSLVFLFLNGWCRRRAVSNRRGSFSGLVCGSASRRRVGCSVAAGGTELVFQEREKSKGWVGRMEWFVGGKTTMIYLRVMEDQADQSVSLPDRVQDPVAATAAGE